MSWRKTLLLPVPKKMAMELDSLVKLVPFDESSPKIFWLSLLYNGVKSQLITETERNHIWAVISPILTK